MPTHGNSLNCNAVMSNAQNANENAENVDNVGHEEKTAERFIGQKKQHLRGMCH